MFGRRTFGWAVKGKEYTIFKRNLKQIPNELWILIMAVENKQRYGSREGETWLNIKENKGCHWWQVNELG